MDEDLDRVKAAILVCHGADDPMDKPEAIAAFARSLDRASVDWQLISYSGTVHSFTNLGADAVSGFKHRLWYVPLLPFVAFFAIAPGSRTLTTASAQTAPVRSW